ncbi:hypothetical protein ACW4TU_41605 [Streptomyces sp. QTS52]
MEPHLPETLRRLNARIEEQGLARSELLDPRELAAQTALSEEDVSALLRGETPSPGTVEQRVCARIRTLADGRLVRTNIRMSELAADVAERLAISQVWARKLLAGEKVPNVTLLHGLAEFFDVEGGEAFFTAPPDEALNRVLLPRLLKYENPVQDPLQALMEKHGVVGVDLRLHGSLTSDQIEELLVNVLRSIVPPTGDAPR